MADDAQLNIVLQLIDNATAGINSAMNNAKSSMGKFGDTATSVGQSINTVGRELSRTGTIMAGFGTAIVAPFILALSNTSKTSIDVSNQLKQLSFVTDELQTAVATALLPTIKDFTDQIGDLFAKFESLSPSMQKMIITSVFLFGEFLLGTGVIIALVGHLTSMFGLIGKLIGSVTTLASVFGTSTIIIAGVAALFVGLIALMIQYDSVGHTVMNGLESLFVAYRITIDGIGIAFEGLAEIAVDALLSMVRALALLPGPQQAFFKGMADGLDKSRIGLQEMANKDLADVQSAFVKIGSLLTGGEGDWSKSFDAAKKAFQDFMSVHKSGSQSILDDTRALNQQITTLDNQLNALLIGNNHKELQDKINTLNSEINYQKFAQNEYKLSTQNMTDFTVALGKSIQNNLSTAIEDIITGAKNAKQAFADFGQAMIKTIVDFMVQKAVAFALEKTFIAGATALGIATGVALTAAYAPAALAANIMSFGGAASAAASTFPVALASENTSLLMAGKFHDGGMITGIGTDEIPIIAQTGEGILSRRGMSALGGENNLNALNSGQSSGNGVTVIVNYPKMSSKSEVQKLANDLGFEIQRQLRYAI